MTITATKRSDFFNQEKHEIHPLKAKSQQHKQPFHHSNPNMFSDSAIDNINLSQNAIDLLRSVSQKIQNILKQHSNYQHLFISLHEMKSKKNSLQDLTFLNRSKHFLSSPDLLELSKKDEKFSIFYEQIKSLNKQNKMALKKIQEEIRSRKEPSYHYLFKKGR